MDNNWKLIMTNEYFDAEVELAKLFCQGSGIELQIVQTQYPYLMKQGKLPILIIGPKLYKKGDISKYLINLLLKTNNPNYEQYFNVFDSCYQMLEIIDYFMWAANDSQNYKYRDMYSFWNPINKFHQITFLVQQRKYFKNKGYVDINKITNRANIHLTIIQHFIQIQHQEHKPITIFYLFCYSIIKSITYNLRYSPLFGKIIKSDLKTLLYQMLLKINDGFQLQLEQLQIREIAVNYNKQLNQLIEQSQHQKEKISKHRLILQVICVALFIHALRSNEFR